MRNCPTIRASVPDPCPRRVRDGDCTGCRDDWNERASIGEYLGRIPRAMAEDAATRAALSSLPGQRNLLG